MALLALWAGLMIADANYSIANALEKLHLKKEHTPEEFIELSVEKYKPKYASKTYTERKLELLRSKSKGIEFDQTLLDRFWDKVERCNSLGESGGDGFERRKEWLVNELKREQKEKNYKARSKEIKILVDTGQLILDASLTKEQSEESDTFFLFDDEEADGIKKSIPKWTSYIPMPTCLKTDKDAHENDGHQLTDISSIVNSKQDPSSPILTSPAIKLSMHLFISIATILLVIVWTAIIIIDFTRVLGPMNHYEVLEQFVYPGQHPSRVFDPAVALIIPSFWFWIFMWGMLYLSSLTAAVLILLHVTQISIGFKSIYYDVGIFYPVLLACICGMQVTLCQMNGVAAVSQKKTLIVFISITLLVSNFLHVLCRQRRVMINPIAWFAGPGFTNQLAMISLISIFIFVAAAQSYTQQVAEGVAFAAVSVVFIIAFIYFCIDAGAYYFLEKPSKYPKTYKTFTFSTRYFFWTPCLFSTLTPSIYYVGIMYARNNNLITWMDADVDSEFKKGIFVISAIAAIVLLLLSLISITLAIVSYFSNTIVNNHNEVEKMDLINRYTELDKTKTEKIAKTKTINFGLQPKLDGKNTLVENAITASNIDDRF